jgi:hypothetical protein
MGLQEVGKEDMDWIYSIQYREEWLVLVNTAMNLGFL